MKTKMGVLCALLGVLSASAFIGQQAYAQSTTPAKAVPVFVPMPKDIQCELGGLSAGSIDVGTNSLKVNHGYWAHDVTCWIVGQAPEQKKDVPIASGDIVNGILSTNTFGKLRINIGNGSSSGAVSIAIRRDKLQALRAFLSKPMEIPPAAAQKSPEEVDWNRATADGTAAAYKTFLSLHPNSPRVREISGQAVYMMVLPEGQTSMPGVVRMRTNASEPPTSTTVVGDDAHSIREAVIKIEGEMVYLDIANAESLGLVNVVGGGLVLDAKKPGLTTLYAGQQGDKLVLLAIEGGSLIRSQKPQAADLGQASDGDNSAKVGNGQTALHRAAAACSNDTVESLLAHGADVRAKDASGLTPWDLAVRAELDANHRFVEELMKHKDDQAGFIAQYFTSSYMIDGKSPTDRCKAVEHTLEQHGGHQ